MLYFGPFGQTRMYFICNHMFLFQIVHGVMRILPEVRAADLYDKPATMNFNYDLDRWEVFYDKDGSLAATYR